MQISFRVPVKATMVRHEEYQFIFHHFVLFVYFLVFHSG